MNPRRSTVLCALVLCLAPLASAWPGYEGIASAARGLLDATKTTPKGVPELPFKPNPILPKIDAPPKPIFEATVGAAFGTQASIAQTGASGDCLAQSFSVGTGHTVAIGGGQSQVGGNLTGNSGCGDNAKPLQAGASFTSGFVLTGAVKTGTVGGPTNCVARTDGSGRSNTVTRGDINTSSGGAFNGASSCDKSKTG